MSISLQQNIFFDKLILKRDPNHLDRIIDEQGNEVDYSKVDLRGAVAITRRGSTWLGKLIEIVQKIHTVIFRKNADSHLQHGIIILGQEEKNKLLIAHVDRKGVRTFSKNYFEHKGVTEIVIYIPKEARLREMVARHAEQTAYTEGRFRQEGKFYPKENPKFAVFDLIRCPFTLFSSKKRLQKRISYIVADLLLGNQIQNRKGKLRPLFCMPYVMSVLQGSALLSSLSEEQAEKLLIQGECNRKKIAKLVYWKLQDPTRSNTLSKAFYEHDFCQLDPRFVMPQYAATAMDKASQKVSVADLSKNLPL